MRIQEPPETWPFPSGAELAPLPDGTRVAHLRTPTAALTCRTRDCHSPHALLVAAPVGFVPAFLDLAQRLAVDGLTTLVMCAPPTDPDRLEPCLLAAGALLSRGGARSVALGGAGEAAGAVLACASRMNVEAVALFAPAGSLDPADGGRLRGRPLLVFSPGGAATEALKRAALPPAAFHPFASAGPTLAEVVGDLAATLAPALSSAFRQSREGPTPP